MEEIVEPPIAYLTFIRTYKHFIILDYFTDNFISSIRIKSSLKLEYQTKFSEIIYDAIATSYKNIYPYYNEKIVELIKAQRVELAIQLHMGEMSIQKKS
jgi:hypothetical protein